MGPAVDGTPYIDAVQFSDGWLEVHLRREFGERQQRIHLLCLYDGGDERTIHEMLPFPAGTKRVTARFRPISDNTSLKFEPVVHVGGQPSQQTVETTPEMTPAWIELRILNAARPDQEYDQVSALIETDASTLNITDIDENHQFPE
jgi:hypothetical protein